ncbi:MAG TPA: hypothetical protein VGR84_17935 [Candidatus Acidoferrales bacterium]|nr:hypothetical protein [Candidatus Acidoferrales bacterium]
MERIRDFYMVGPLYKNILFKGRDPDKDYRSQVLSRSNKANPVFASLEWLKESEAIGQEDLVAFEECRALRNKLVHGLPQVLTSGLPCELGTRFSELISLLDKIERWWIVNVDMATDPKLCEEEIDHESIIPGRILALRAMLDVASSSRAYMEGFLEHTKCEGAQ